MEEASLDRSVDGCPVRGGNADAGRLADELVRAHETFLLIALLFLVK